MKVREANVTAVVGRALNVVGAILLVVGGLVGWGLPHATWLVASAPPLATPLAALHADVSSYLGADITALAVIIAVVIGFSATMLQITSQSQSLTVVRGIVGSAMPFLLCWGGTTAVALVYFLLPPVYALQLWQALLWFGAIVSLMLAYLFLLPERLSGRYTAQLAIRELRGKPIERWESLDGFSVLVSEISASSARGDLGTSRALTIELGVYLCGRLDARAEQERGYVRARYRALKNLLSGCAQNAGAGPNAAAYHLGYVVAGVLLQGSAIGLPMDDGERDFFSGLARGLRGTPERFDSLWTGVRHALCRRSTGGSPFLPRYWEAHRSWANDDPRAVADVAGALARLHAVARQRMALSPESGVSVNDDAVGMLSDLYRDIARYLAREVADVRGARQRDVLLARCSSLLDAVHARALELWGLPDGDATRAAVTRAYEERREELRATLAADAKR